MSRILRTRASRADYDEIWSYIAKDNIAAADRLIDEFDATLQTIAASPLIGRKVNELEVGLRSIPVGNYLIFYRLIADGIELIRVVHGARDVNPDYFEEE
jgi:toxin ParE1/3/4